VGQIVRLPRISPVTAVVVGLLVALAAGNLATSPLIPQGTGLKGVGIITLPFAVVGLVVARRQPRNPIGWIFLALTFGVLVSVNAANYSVLVYRVHDALPFGRLAVALAPAWVPVIILMPLPIVLFPDGRIPRGRWKWVFWTYIALAVSFVAALGSRDLRAFTDRRVVIASNGSLDYLTGPYGRVAGDLNTAAAVAYVVCFLAMVIYQVVRFRHARGDERQQLKWFLTCGGIAVGGLFLAAQFNVLSFLFVCIVLLPLGIGFGILKYRLYDVDRLISRSLSYAIVTATLVAVFGGLVLLTTRVLPFSSPVGVAASTLAAAALFNPLRRRVQRVVDRRFNRARYDAEATVAAFGARLRDAVDVEAVLDELAVAAGRSLEPTHVTVWVRAAS
jgi:hypothetical protein